MPTRALRGATTATENSASAIHDATRELLLEIVRANELDSADLVSALFTMTPDLDAAFPARAARELGWTRVALLDAQSPHVEGDLPHCIRVLIHINTEKTVEQIRHIYLRAARTLRPDFSQ
jgi:chorismate mutase